MKILNKLAVASAVAFCMAGSAYASPIDVDGVTWDPSNSHNISELPSESITINQTTGMLTGFGNIVLIDSATTACNNCTLNFVFTAFTPTTAGAVPNTGSPSSTIDYTGGTLSFYVDSGLTVPTTSAEITAGQLFLSTSVLGTSTVTVANDGDSFTLAGLADATGGAAQNNFNTDKVDNGAADLSFSFTFDDLTSNTGLNGAIDAADGGGSIHGFTIPEPGSVALAGLGLLALAGLRRRRNM